MALNPIETLNVFEKDLRTELRNRSFSKNLIQTRTPFLRFTTAANVTDLLNSPENKEKFRDYDGCKFFTLGIHGYENVNYSVDDLYGTQAQQGLVVGTTYTNGQQRLVRTFGGLQSRDSAKNYPPPGIVSAKVERLRNGNVLKFTVETQCYTQEQLEMLDALCYIPGMTCVLEWGNQFSTLSGPKTINPKLDFTKVGEVTNTIRSSLKLSRQDFIKSWCEPNDYNYDWAVANIANIQTRVDNNIYKTTIIAYGRADNLMYISAYATTNPLNNTVLEREKDTIKSITEYFTLNGRFTRFLDNVVIKSVALENSDRDQVVTFRDQATREKVRNDTTKSQDTGKINDLGFENVYFITFDFFIKYILNSSRYGLLGIINRGLSDTYKLDALISPLVDGSDVITCGYNKYLRSTSPETLLIYNPNATGDATATRAINASLIRRLESRGTVPPRIEQQESPALTRIKKQAFGADIGGSSVTTDSGTALLSRGVWLNSRAIQSAFINARTIMEGLETLLRNINAATENYWDLKLYYDDDRQQFRILDDNNRTLAFTATDKIYEFNKKLENTDGNTIGPDVIDIQIDTDFPKLLFSQLAISGINGGYLTSNPQRTNVDFIQQTSVGDIFSTEDAVDPTIPSIDTGLPFTFITLPSLQAFADDLFNTLIKNTLGTSITRENLLITLRAGFGETINENVQNLLRNLFAIPTLLTEDEARRFRNTLTELKNNNEITEQQIVTLTNLFAERTKAIIRRLKSLEVEALTNAYNSWKNSPEQDVIRQSGFLTDQPITVVTRKINASRDTFLTLIDDAVRLSQEQDTEARRQRILAFEFEQRRRGVQ
jgi:hypothetical protein